VRPNKCRATRVIREADPRVVRRYLRYWRAIAPACDRRYYNAFLFAFLSVHAGWEMNVRAFAHLRKLGTDFTRRQLRRALEAARIGLYDMREAGIWGFHRAYWDRPDWWRPAPAEGLAACRDRLLPALSGLHLAKTSFALELAFPAASEVVCLDVHLLRLYGIERPDRPRGPLYRELEAHWTGKCGERGLPSPMVRHAFWDRLQHKPDCRYWSFVLEE
jgi:hypothetical protein